MSCMIVKIPLAMLSYLILVMLVHHSVAMESERLVVNTTCLELAKPSNKHLRLSCDIPKNYHCLLDESYTREFEVCKGWVWISEGKCAYFNSFGQGNIDQKECRQDENLICSPEEYPSNQITKYSACYVKKGGYREEISKESSTLKPEPPILPLPLMAGIIAAVVVVLCLLLSAVCVIHIKRRRRRRGRGKDVFIENKNEDCCQQQRLLDQSIPVDLQKSYEYVKSGVFSSSKFYEHAIGVLDIHGCVSLIGPPGSGKTLTAVQLAFQKYRGGQGGMSRLIVYHTVKELTETEPPDGAYIILDDWLDQYMHFPDKLEEDEKLLDGFYAYLVKSKKVCIIFTSQQDRWKCFQKSLSNCPLFKTQCLLTISSKSFSKSELRKMIHSNIKHCYIEEEDSESKDQTINVENLLKIKWDREFSFPLIVDLICVNRRWKRIVPFIEKDGFSTILRMFFEKWLKDEKTEEKRSFCILVFAAFLGGKVSSSQFKSEITRPIYERICQEFSCNSENKLSVERQIFNVEDECLDAKKTNSENQPYIVEDIKTEHTLKENLYREGYQEEIALLHENQRLKSCLYKVGENEEDPVFVFHHNALFQFVLQYIFESTRKQFFIDNASFDVLINNCCIAAGIYQRYVANTDQTMLLSPAGMVSFQTDVLKPLAKRIYSEVKDNYAFRVEHWPNHVFMKNYTFSKTWGTMCVN
ncbi:uncharacterized protein LOC144625935 [Crassostrea virginica]